MRDKKKKNKYLIIIVCSALLLAVLVFAFRFSKQGVSTNRLPLSLKIEGAYGTEEIFPTNTAKNKWYFFIPAYANPDSILLCAQENDCYLDNRQLKNEQPLGKVAANTAYAFEQRTKDGAQSCSVYFMRSSKIATMYIQTPDRTMQAVYSDKTHKEPIAIRLVDETGNINYSGNGEDSIRGRGNTTWGLPKKPFHLFLSKDASLLGMSKSQNWILLANGFDKTNLRNKLIYDFASEIDMGWTPHCEYVDLYLNGRYNGLYLLSESIELSQSKLSKSNYDKDYLFESVQLHKASPTDTVFFVPAHRSSSLYFKIDYPKNCTEEMLAQIQQDVTLLYRENKNDNLDRLDLNSWTKHLLIDEVFLNLDAAISSSFYYFNSDTGKYYANFIWDYDLSLGNPGSNWTQKSTNPNQIWTLSKDWYSNLYENEAFYQNMLQVYEEQFLPKLKQLLIDLPAKYDKILASSINNSIRWRNMFDSSVFLNAENTPLKDQYDILFNFLQDRMTYLDTVWLSEKEYNHILWKTGLMTDVTIVENGTLITTFPVSQESLADWYDSETGLPLDFSQPITKNHILYNYTPADPVPSGNDTGGKEVSKPTLPEWLVLHADLLRSLTCYAIFLVIGITLILAERKNRKAGGHDGTA